MSIRFRYASHDLRCRSDGVVHARGAMSLVLCQPNLAGAPVDHTDDPVTCQECSAIRDFVRAVTLVVREDTTHEVRSLPTVGRAGLTRCRRPFAWQDARTHNGYAPYEVSQMRPTDHEVDCMACIAMKIANAQ
jgi:hypothetical protein